ncbi:site-specific integrase [Pseudomonadota bacterium]
MSSSGASSARQRWQQHELVTLFQCPEFNGKPTDFKWATLLMLYHGLRPSEACQLKVSDVIESQGVPCLRVIADGEAQQVKNEGSERLVPLHPKILSRGFLSFVEERRQACQLQLFSYLPTGDNEDWSREYCQALGRLQNKLGMKPKSRPTAYSFRHTVIDELKQLEVDENIVAQLVGHKITYGRYGKKYSVSLLKKHLSKLDYGPEMSLCFITRCFYW